MVRLQLVQWECGEFWVAVEDEGTWLPPSDPGYRGRGLLLIEHLADQSRVTPTGRAPRCRCGGWRDPERQLVGECQSGRRAADRGEHLGRRVVQVEPTAVDEVVDAGLADDALQARERQKAVRTRALRAGSSAIHQ